MNSRKVTVIVDGRPWTVVLNEHGKAFNQDGVDLRSIAEIREYGLGMNAMITRIERAASDTLKEAILSDALVVQKDSILRLLQHGEIETAISLLRFVWQVWDASDYSYKTDELLNIMRRDYATPGSQAELSLDTLFDERAAFYE